MKLSDWAKKQGISYLTAYRWFKDGTLPVQAYQSDSGTIIVQDDSEVMEIPAMNKMQNDVMSVFLKKTVEFSKNESSIEDFAAYILSNFSLKLNSTNDSPKYSRNKPKAEDIQKHFQKFIKPKGEKPKLNMLLLSEGEDADTFIDKVADQFEKNQLEYNTDGYSSAGQSYKDLLETIQTYKDHTIEGVVDCNNTITQSTNYTSSADHTLNSASFSNDTETNFFKPTQKEIESVTKSITQVTGELNKTPKRGRRKFLK